MSRYDKSRITRIYGVEPNTNLHAALLKTVKREGLSDVYTVVGCGIEDGEELGRYGIGVGGEGKGVDCVVCVQVRGGFFCFCFWFLFLVICDGWGDEC